MSDYVALPSIAGLLTAGVDNEVLTFAGDRTVESFQVGLFTPDASGDTIVELRTVAGGVGGLFMQLTIPAGQKVPTVSTPAGDPPFAVAPGDKLYLRVTQTPPMAMGLFGVLQLNSLGGGVVNTGGTQDLTTDSIVLGYMPAAAGIDPAVRDQVRLSVSGRMVEWMGRTFVHPAEAGGPFYQLSTGIETRVALAEWPVSDLVVTIDETPVDVADFRIEEDQILRYLGGGDRARVWPVGDIGMSGTFGYPVSPNSLAHAAAWQTAAELRRIDLRLIGVDQHESQSGVSETLTVDGWLPSVLQAMLPFRRFA